MLTFRSGFVAILFSSAGQVAERLISLVSLVVLARVLTPEDFGLVAIAMIFLNFAQALAATGGDGYLMSREHIDKEMVFTNWTLTLGLHLVLAGILVAGSGYIGDYYDDNRLQAIIIALSFLIVFRKLTSPGLIFKRRKQQLGAISGWMVVTRLIAVGSTIAFAVIFESYWALIIGHFISSFGFNLASYYIAPLKPQLTLKNVKPQWQFSKWLMPQSVINYLKGQIDAIWVSSLFDKPTMGAYNSMRYYTSIPNNMFINTVISTMMPQFAELKSNEAYYKKQLQVMLFILSVICAPLIYLMQYHAEFVVGFILGDKWTPYADFFAIFAFFVASMTINNMTRQVALIKDRPNTLLYFSIISIALQVLMFVSVEFIDAYQLAEYKVTLDIAITSLFFSFLIVSTMGLSTLMPLLLPILPAGLIIVGAGELATNATTSLLGIWKFLAHCSLTMLIYLLSISLMIYIGKDKVYCFAYLLRIFQKSWGMCLAKLKRV